MRDLHTLRRARARADARDLPRARRLLDGPAVERRLDGRRGAQHPRGLRPRVDDARAGVPLLPRGVAVLVRRPERLPRRSRLLRGAAQRPPLEGLRGRRGARSSRRPRRRPPVVAPGQPVPVRDRAGLRDGDPVGDDHAPRDVGQVGERRLLHVHDRVDRRLGPRRAGLGLPAQQRAHRLQLRLDHAPQPRRGRQAAAQLDGADDRPAERQAVPRARLAGRLDDHHDGAPDPLRPARPGDDAAAGDRRPAREPAQHVDDERGAGVPLERAAHAAARRAATRSRTAARSAPQPGSSSSPAGACSPRPSLCAAAAGARSSRTPRRSPQPTGLRRRRHPKRHPRRQRFVARPALGIEVRVGHADGPS